MKPDPLAAVTHDDLADAARMLADARTTATEAMDKALAALDAALGRVTEEGAK